MGVRFVDIEQMQLAGSVLKKTGITDRQTDNHKQTRLYKR